MEGFNQPRRPWLNLGAINVPGDQHDLPKHLETLLPKFDPDNKESLEYHINKFILLVNLMKVEQKYVVCCVFPYTFEGNASTW